MARYTKTQVTQLSANEQAAINAINKNFEDLEAAIQDTVSRSGNMPTHMTHDLDMNGKRIINIPAPTVDTDLVRRKDVVEDMATVQSLVNTAANASAQALEAAQEVEAVLEDSHLVIVADDLALGDDSKITKVANDIGDVSTVASNISSINTVNSNVTNINTVATNITNVNNVGSSISNVNICASNISAITSAPTYANNASNSATAAASSAAAAATAASTMRLSLFDFKWTDYEQADQSWLRADTFSWQNGTVYTNAYNHLVADYQGGTSQTETVGSYTITYVLASDGHKITTDETNVANIYNESGVAWYYILDITNQRFKLPRTKYGFVGLRDTVGKYVEAGLPNITGGFNVSRAGFSSGSGAFNVTNSNGYGAGSSGDFGNGTATFDASDSNSIYGNSTTVQPPATQMYLYCYVGQFSQSATEQTAGLNSELFNGKADIDMGNVPSNIGSIAKSYFAGIGMPSNYSVDMGNTTEYTAPANGYAFFQAASGANNGYVNIVVNENSDSYRQVAQRNATGTQVAMLVMPCKKGDSVICGRQSSGSIGYNKFIYAEGEV